MLYTPERSECFIWSFEPLGKHSSDFRILELYKNVGLVLYLMCCAVHGNGQRKSVTLAVTKEDHQRDVIIQPVEWQHPT